MDQKRFSPFDAAVWGLRSLLDNFRLFGGTLFVAIGICAAWILVLLVFSRFTFFWHQIPDMREFLWQFKLSGVLQPRTTELNFPIITGFGVFMAVGALCMVSLLVLGYTKLCLRFHDFGQESRLSVLFSCWRQTGSFLVALFLYTLMILFGLSFFILPGIYLALRFGFFKYVMVDTGAGIIESLRKSYAMTAGCEWALLGLMMFAMLAGRLFPLWPAMELMYVSVYRKLVPQSR